MADFGWSYPPGCDNVPDDLDPDEAHAEPEFEPTERCKAFLEFHAANPGVYGLFYRFATEAIRGGRPHFGSRFIGERIRWYCAVENPGVAYKINDHVWPYYSRLLMLRSPIFVGVFARRNKHFDTTDQDLLLLVDKAEQGNDV